MKKEKRKVTFLKIFSYYWLQIKKYPKSFFAPFFFYSIGITLAYTFIPLYYKEIVDLMGASGNNRMMFATELTSVIGQIAITILAYQICFRLGDVSMTYSQTRILEQVSNFSFKNLIKHSYRFFTNRFSGSLVASAKRFEASFETIQEQLIFGYWMTGVHLLGVSISLFIVAKPLGVFFFLWAFFYIITTCFLAQRKISYDLREANADSDVTSVLSDAIANIVTVKTFAGGEREEKYFAEVTHAQQERRKESWMFVIRMYNVQSFFLFILEVIGVYLSVHLWLAGEITTGVLVLANSYFADIFHHVWELSRTTTRFMKALSNASEMVEIFETPQEIKDSSHPRHGKFSSGQIVFENVGFSYGNGKNLLSDFSFTVSPGERVGIVGASGAGKSTLIKLLLRFFDVTSGAIKIDGQDIRTITQDDLRRAIAYVPQDPVLFHRTLRENIGYGKEKVSLAEIKRVSEKAHAHEFISGLPQKYETLVGERGVKLSGGERQRVAIARAMLQDSPILVLDEATSSLDSTSELLIRDGFTELMKDKTTIVIAHRLSTIQSMDRIVVLDHGKILEQGSHDELLAKKGAYFTLWSHQTNGFLPDESSLEDEEENGTQI